MCVYTPRGLARSALTQEARLLIIETPRTQPFFLIPRFLYEDRDVHPAVVDEV